MKVCISTLNGPTLNLTHIKEIIVQPKVYYMYIEE